VFVCLFTYSFQSKAQPCVANFNFVPQNGNCLSTFSFSNQSTGAALTYSWNFDDPGSGLNNTSTSTNPTHQFISGGAYNVCLVISRISPYCSDTICKTVNVNPIASLIDVLGSSFINCASGSIFYDLYVTDNSTGSSFINFYIDWGDNTAVYNSSSSPNSLMHTYSGLGYFYLTYVVTTSNGCTDTLIQSVYNGTNPAVGLANPGNTNGCIPLSLTFPITQTATNPPGTIYTITVNDGSSPIVFSHPPPASVTHVFNTNSCGASTIPFNSYTVSITAQNPCDQSGATVYPIYVSSPPVANFTFSPSPGCINQQVLFTNTSINSVNTSSILGCDSSDRQNWIISPSTGWFVSSGVQGVVLGVFPPGSDSLGITFTSPGLYDITLIVRSASSNNCGNDTITQQICVTGPPTAAFTVNPNQGCVPLNISTTNNTTVVQNCVPSNYNWTIGFTPNACSINSGSYIFTGATNNTSVTPTLQLQDAGIYNLTLTGSNVCGSTTVNRSINVGSPPLVTVNSINSACGGLTFIPSAVINDCNQPIGTYSWLFPSGTPLSSNLQNPGVVTYSNSTTNSINYVVTASATNSCGTGSDTAQFTLYPIPVPIASALPATICTGQSTQLSLAQAGIYSSITWSNGGSGSPVTVTPAVTNVYTVTVSNSYGCVGIDTAKVIVNPLPLVSTGPTINICQNAPSMQITGASPIGGVWSGAGVNASGLFNPALVLPGSVSLTYSFTDPVTGCTNSSSQQVNVIALPIVTATSPISLCNAPGLIILNSVANPSPIGGTWFGAFITSGANFNPSLAGIGPHVVNYTYTSSLTGCSDTVQVIINVISPATANAGPNFSICVSASSFQLNGSPLGGMWSGTGVGPSGLFDPALSGAGLFVITYSYGTGSCLSQDTMTILVNALPIVNAGNGQSFCIDAGVQQLIGTPVGGTWSGTGVNVSGLFNPLNAIVGVNTLTYSFTDVNGCSNSAIVAISVNPIPIVDAGPNLSFCDTNLIVQLTGAIPSGGVWSGSNIASGGALNLGPLTPGMFTYFYSYSDLNGCDAIDSIVVTILAPTIASAGSNFSICINSSAVTLNGTPAGGVWSGSGIIGNSFSPALAGVGIWVLTYTFGTGSCLLSHQILVTVNPLPVVNAGSPQSLCIDASPLQLIGSPSLGIWSGSGVNGPGLFNPLIGSIGSNLLTYTFSDANGCSSSSNVSITVNPIPVVDAGPNLSFCDTNLNVQVIGATPLNGVWNGTGISSSGLLNLGLLNPGQYLYYYIFTDVNGCDAIDSMQVTITSPVAANAGSDFSICINAAPAILTGLPLGGTWSGSGVIGNSFNSAIAGAGTWILTYTYGNGTCQTSDQILATVFPLPLISMGIPQSFCIDAGIQQLNGSPIGGTWTGTAVNSSGQFNPFLAGSGVFIQTYSIVDLNGCTNSTNFNITVNLLPVVDAGLNLTFCDTNLVIQITSGTPINGIWSGGSILSNGSLDLGPLSPGVYTFYYTFFDSNGCDDIDSLQVTITSPTQALAGSDTLLCIDANLFILNGQPIGGIWSGSGVIGNTFNPSSAGSGNWPLTYTYGNGTCQTSDQIVISVAPLPIVDAGNALAFCIDAGVQQLIGTPLGGNWVGTAISMSGQFNPQQAGIGNYYLYYTHVDNNSCSNTDSVYIQVNPLPLVFAGPDTSYCYQPINAQLPIPSPIGGNWNGPGIINASTGIIDPVLAGIGTHILVYVFSDINGCENSDTILVTITNPANVYAGNDTSVCISTASFMLNASPSGGFWSGNIVASTGLVNPNQSGTFNLIYSYGSGTCLKKDSILVFVNPLPNINLSGNLQSICVDQPSFNLIATPVGGIWAGIGILGSSFIPSIAGPGTTTITYSYTDLNGCSNSDSLSILVHPLPVVFAGNDTTVCDLPMSVNFYGNFNNAGIWSGQGVSSSGVFNSPGVGVYSLSYTFTDGNGCENIDTMIVTVVTPQVADAGPGDTICVDAGVLILPGFFPSNGGVWTGPGIINSATGLFDPVIAFQNFTTTTSITLYYNYGAGNCYTIDSTVVVIHPLPVVNAGIDIDTCISVASFALPGFSPFSGWWTGFGVTDSLIGMVSPVLAGAGSHNLIYTFISPITGCRNNDTLVLKIDPLPVPGFNIDSVLCINSSYSPLNISSGGNAWYWDFGNGITSTLQNPSVIYSSIGIYTILQIVISPEGCIDSISKVVKVVEPPQPSFTLQPNEGCGPLQVIFTNTSQSFDPSYLWNFGNGVTDTSSSPPPITYFSSLYNDTTYYITLSIANLCGTVSFIDSVLVHPTPTSYFGINVNSGCSPLTVNFSNNSYGLPTSYLWVFGDGTSTTDSIPTPHTYFAFNNDTTYYVTLISYNDCGSDTLVDSVLVHPNTVNAFFNTNPTQGCAPLTVDFTNYSTGASIYSWDFGDGDVSNQFNTVHVYDTAGSFTIQLVVTNGCSFDTVLAQVNVWPQPILDFTISKDSICPYESLSLVNISSSQLINTTWYWGDGDSSISSNPQHQYTAAGTYFIGMVGTGALHGCMDTIYKTVLVHSQPSSGFDSLFNSGCQPLLLNFNNTSQSASGYVWSFGDNNFSTTLHPQHTYFDSGVFTITQIAYSLFGCTDTTTGTVVVHPKPIAEFDVMPDSSCVHPVLVQFINLSSDSTGSFWDINNGTTSTLINPSYTFNNIGSNNISLFVVNNYGCRDTATTIYNVYPTPQAEFSTPDPDGCEDYLVSFNNSSLNGIYYYWDFGDGGISTETSPNYLYTNPGVYDVALIIVGAGGCRDTAIIQDYIHVDVAPVASFNYIKSDNPTLYGAIQFINNSIGGISYSWDFGDGTTSNLFQPIHRYDNYGDYLVTLIVTNDLGCTDTATLPVQVDYFKGLFVPNAFTPLSGPEAVRKFLPKGKGLKSYRLEIFDTWGIKLWESILLDNGSPHEGWEGMYNGTILQQDVYLWKIYAEFEDGSVWPGQKREGIFRTTGTVTLLR